MHVVPKFVSLGCILRQQKFSYPDYRGKEKKEEREREKKREREKERGALEKGKRKK